MGHHFVPPVFIGLHFGRVVLKWVHGQLLRLHVPTKQKLKTWSDGNPVLHRKGQGDESIQQIASRKAAS